ncbi:unnamed protein product [Closterium sp. NIES-53]
MLTDVQRHVALCPTCQLMKSSRQRPAAQLQSIPPPERAWQQVTMDFVTGLPARPKKQPASSSPPSFDYTGYQQRSSATATRNSPATYGGTCGSTSARETDGQTERRNQTMEQLIRAMCDDPTTWEQQMPLIEFAYNNSPSATTQQSSFYLNYGQDPTVHMTPNPCQRAVTLLASGPTCSRCYYLACRAPMARGPFFLPAVRSWRAAVF